MRPEDTVSANFDNVDNVDSSPRPSEILGTFATPEIWEAIHQVCRPSSNPDSIQIGKKLQRRISSVTDSSATPVPTKRVRGASTRDLEMPSIRAYSPEL